MGSCDRRGTTVKSRPHSTSRMATSWKCSVSSLARSQPPHESVNLSLTNTIIKNKWTDSCGKLRPQGYHGEVATALHVPNGDVLAVLGLEPRQKSTLLQIRQLSIDDYFYKESVDRSVWEGASAEVPRGSRGRTRRPEWRRPASARSRADFKDFYVKAKARSWPEGILTVKSRPQGRTNMVHPRESSPASGVGC